MSTVPGRARLAPRTVVVVASLSGLVLAVLAVAGTPSATYAAYRLGLDPDEADPANAPAEKPHGVTEDDAVGGTVAE